jgi:PHD/YefM family antitoxin component YafN of YafNO toxin-antitoxin module
VTFVDVVPEVPAQEVRRSAKVAAALAERRPVAVNRYGKRFAVLLSAEQFDLVAPLLELLQGGTLVSPELLKTEEDFELERTLAHDRLPGDAEDEQIAELLEASRLQP